MKPAILALENIVRGTRAQNLCGHGATAGVAGWARGHAVAALGADYAGGGHEGGLATGLGTLLAGRLLRGGYNRSVAKAAAQAHSRWFIPLALCSIAGSVGGTANGFGSGGVVVRALRAACHRR